jgi:hypothetical protein
MSPDEFSFYGFEERLDGDIIIAISFAAHPLPPLGIMLCMTLPGSGTAYVYMRERGYLEAILTQDFLVVVRTILRPTIRMVNAVLGR